MQIKYLVTLINIINKNFIIILAIIILVIIISNQNI